MYHLKEYLAMLAMNWVFLKDARMPVVAYTPGTNHRRQNFHCSDSDPRWISCRRFPITSCFDDILQIFFPCFTTSEITFSNGLLEDKTPRNVSAWSQMSHLNSCYLYFKLWAVIVSVFSSFMVHSFLVPNTC